jgi:23S rRNA (guanosine2251-2'-O)-methyltransferase
MAKFSPQKSRNSSHSQKKGFRPHPKAEQLIWGIHPVLEALKACPQAISEIAIDRDRTGHRLEQILELARKNAIPVTAFPDKSKTGIRKPAEVSEHESSQGVSALIIMPNLALSELLVKLKTVAGPPLLLALDSIQDPHNLGAMIRSAVAAGVHGIILPRDRSASITGTVIKISAGAVFHIDICTVTNLVNSFKILKEHGIWIFGASREAARPIYDADLTVPACLVIGSEGKGLRPLVADHCDQKIAIPMQSSLDSLNASVAAGIILFEIVRQRRSQYR